jgi:hypothetical protein
LAWDFIINIGSTLCLFVGLYAFRIVFLSFIYVVCVKKFYIRYMIVWLTMVCPVG